MDEATKVRLMESYMGQEAWLQSVFDAARQRQIARVIEANRDSADMTLAKALALSGKVRIHPHLADAATTGVIRERLVGLIITDRRRT